MIANVDRKIQWVNQAFESITGYSLSEFQGQTCHFVQGELTNPETVVAIREALKNGLYFHGEILNYRKNGEVFWNDLSISPIRDEHGESTSFIGVMRDVSPRKLIEKEKQLSDERLWFTLKASNVGLWEWDFKTGDVILSNEIKSQLGYNEDEMESKYSEWETRVHPDGPPIGQRTS